MNANGGVIEFTVLGKPKGQTRPQAYYRRPKGGEGKGFASVYDGRLDVEWKNLVFLQVREHRPPAPLAGVPFRLTCTFTMPMPTTWPKYRQDIVRGGGLVYHIIDPDLDQLIKPIMDMMKAAGYFYDDNQVADLGGSRKIYGVVPGVHVRLEALGLVPLRGAR